MTMADRGAVWGCPWHGLLLDVSANNETIRENRLTLTMRGGRVKELSPGTSAAYNWSYLWDIGLPDLESTEDESDAGMEWWGKAILSSKDGARLSAYGSVDFGQGWPVLLDGELGRVNYSITKESVFNDPAERADFVFTFIRARDGQIRKVTLSQVDQGLGTSQPTVYAFRPDREQDKYVVYTGAYRLLDITRRGQFALLGIESNVYGFQEGERLGRSQRGGICYFGLLEVALAGTFDDPKVSVSVLLNKTQALGTLVDTRTGSLSEQLYEGFPMEVVSQGKCGPEHWRYPAGYRLTNGDVSAGWRVKTGGQSITFGQTGAMAGAWYGPDGAVQIATFSHVIELTNSVSFSPSGSGSQDFYVTFDDGCQVTENRSTDTSAVTVDAHSESSRTETITLYGPGGDLVGTNTQKTVSILHLEYRKSAGQIQQGNSYSRSYGLINGAVYFDDTTKRNDLEENEKVGSEISAPKNVYTFENGFVGVSDRYIFIHRASNKAILLATALQGNPRTNGSRYEYDYDILCGAVLTPAGINSDGYRIIEYRSSGIAEFGSSLYQFRTLRAAYNPVTKALARAPDLKEAANFDFGWI
jgi:hypothetical protein